MKTIGLLLIGVCYAVLVIHVVRTLRGYYHPPHPQDGEDDVTYMGKPARIEYRGLERSRIVMKGSGAHVWVQNKNLNK